LLSQQGALVLVVTVFIQYTAFEIEQKEVEYVSHHAPSRFSTPANYNNAYPPYSPSPATFSFPLFPLGILETSLSRYRPVVGH